MDGLLLLYVLTGSAVFAQACDEAGVTQCQSDFSINYPYVRSGYALFRTGQQLTELCTDAETFLTCTEAAIDGCTQDVIDAFQYEEDTINYICSDTSREILTANAACVTSTTLQLETVSCVNSYKSVRGNVSEPWEICNAMKEFVRCNLDVGERECNEEFASWYAGYIDIALVSTYQISICESTAACDLPRVRECRAAFFNNNNINNNRSNILYEYSVLFTGQLLTDVCAKAETYQTCTEATIDNCPREIIDGLQPEIDIQNYICSDTSRDILAANAACAKWTTLKQEIGECFLSSVNQLQQFANDTEKICDALKEILTCALKVSERECNKDFASWFVGYLDLTLFPTKLYGCEFSAADLVSSPTSMATPITSSPMSMATSITSSPMSMATSMTSSIVILVSTLVMTYILEQN